MTGSESPTFQPVGSPGTREQVVEHLLHIGVPEMTANSWVDAADSVALHGGAARTAVEDNGKPLYLRRAERGRYFSAAVYEWVEVT